MNNNFRLLTPAEKPRNTGLAPRPRSNASFRQNDASAGQEGGADWIGMLGALRRHWRLALAFMVIVVAVTAAVSFVLKPVYEPTARVEVDPPGSEAFSMQSNNSSPTDVDNLIETQTQILRSDELGLQLVRTLHLDKRADVIGTPKNDQVRADADGISPAEDLALSYVEHNLKAVPVKNSRVIRISFASRDPLLARDTVNALVQLYIENNYKTRYDAVTQSSEWLARQLADIKEKAERSTQALVAYQQKHGITDIDEKQNTFAQKVAGLNQQLTLAQSDRIQLEALHRSIEAGEGDSLPQVRDNPVVQDLTKKIADTEAELSQVQVIYGAKHPNVVKLRNRLNVLQSQLGAERKSLKHGIETSFTAAQARERLMAGQAQAATTEINSLGEYGLLKKDAETNTALYNTLYARVKEAGIAAASKSSNIRVIERARLLDKPTWPRPLENIALALLCGLIGGVMIALMRDKFDESIRVPEEAVGYAGLPAIAFIPSIEDTVAPAPPLLNGSIVLPPGPQHQPFVVSRPSSNEAEAVRALFSSLVFSTDDHLKVLVVSSPAPQEGKTMLAVNLAAAMAARARTCIVEADLRRPSVERSFGIRAPLGFGDVLSGYASLESALANCPKLANLSILGAGRAARNPGALLMSKELPNVIAELRSRFSYVVIDTPPLLAYADARALAPLADGVVLVARQRQTGREAVTRCVEVLGQLHVRLLGLVLNDVNENARYYKYYGAGYGA